MNIVVITGASSGIGKATAELLSNEYRIINIDIAPCPNGFEFYQCHLSKKEEILKVTQKIKEKYDSLYALINNAGKMIRQDLEDQTIEEWEEVIGLNLTAPYILSKEFAPLLEREHGHIVNISSTRAKMSEANTESYSASKGGLESLTHALAVTLSGKVAVNSISPGWINTTDYEPTKEEHKDHPIGRVGKPGDIASFIDYLLSNNDGFITGSNFVIDGGMTKKMVYV